MSSWSLLLCEGAHDQEFLCCLATSAGQWQHAKKHPEGVPPAFDRAGTFLFLQHADGNLIIANLNGVDNILGDKGRVLVETAARTAKTVGVMLDADDTGVVLQTKRVRTHFGPCLPAAASADAGSVVTAPNEQQDQRRLRALGHTGLQGQRSTG